MLPCRAPVANAVCQSFLLPGMALATTQMHDPNTPAYVPGNRVPHSGERRKHERAAPCDPGCSRGPFATDMKIGSASGAYREHAPAYHQSSRTPHPAGPRSRRHRAL